MPTSNRVNLTQLPLSLVRAAAAVFNAPNWESRILFRDSESGAFMLRLNRAAHWFIFHPSAENTLIYLGPADFAGQALADNMRARNADIRHDMRVSRYQSKVNRGVRSGIRLAVITSSGVSAGQPTPDAADNSGRSLPAISVG